jgi:hypothetical protein
MEQLEKLIKIINENKDVTIKGYFSSILINEITLSISLAQLLAKRIDNENEKLKTAIEEAMAFRSENQVFTVEKLSHL